MKSIKKLLILISLVNLISSCQNTNKPTSYTIVYEEKKGKEEEVLTHIEGISKIRLIGRDGGYLAWSSNGKQFAFYAKYDNKKTWSIHTMNIDGTNRKRLTHAENKWDSSPAWSPDGKKIAFTREYKDLNGIAQSEIWIMNADGSKQTHLQSLKGSNPCFTPDGRIVFSSEFKDKKSELSITDIDGNNITQLTNNESNEYHPDVSPDGKQIAFMSDRDGNYEIYVMNIDGSNQQRLTNNNVDDWYPSWSPDSSKIIFSLYNNYKEDRHIYIINKDGSSPQKIIPNCGYAVFKY